MTESSNPRVYVAESPIHGRGLFAARDISTGEFIGHYESRIVEHNDIYVLWIENDDGESWTGHEGHNEMRFLNHDSRPNAEMYDLDCFALSDIPKDTEITIDYGWDSA